jgi:hypothetical protein
VDITFLQLLCSIHYYSNQHKIIIKKKGEVPLCLKELADNVGFYFTIEKCKLKNNCLLNDMKENQSKS